MPIQAILQLVAGLMPVANALIETLSKIKNATEKDHPEIWAKVRDDWKSTAEEWRKLTQA